MVTSIPRLATCTIRPKANGNAGHELMLEVMPGASKQTRRVENLNANWVAGSDGDDCRFEVMIVTEDDQQHTMSPSPASMSALIALSQRNVVPLWDPADRTLIAANVVGSMPWTEHA